jgi:DNA-binding response OmpR family regulator
MEKKDKVILVLEDERPLQEAIRIKLEKSGIDVVTARNVEQAKLYVLDLGKIDAIWLDHYLMGKENGLDFIAWCREEKSAKCRLTPIFVVSNTASYDKVSTYLSFGAKKYFVKSNYKLEEIIAEIIKELYNENVDIN